MIERCFIMFCGNNTEKECLDRELFGGPEWIFEYLKEIQVGDFGLLLNIDTDELIGVFKAVSRAGINLEPDAWGGKFPAQIRVKPIPELKRIPNASSIFEEIGIKLTVVHSKSGKPVPKFPVYGQNVAKKLLEHFQENEEIKSLILKKTLPIIHEEKITFEDVIGLEEVKKFILDRMVKPIIEFEEAKKYYLRVGGGVLLYGPPGTGKTLIGVATANEIDAEFIELTPSIIYGYPGEPEKKIEELFQHLLNCPRSVLFIDEAEALLARREEQRSTVMQRVTPVLLSQFARLSRDRFKPILVICATNIPWNIDPAFFRPGRIDKHVYVRLPNKRERIKLLELFLKKRADECVAKSLFFTECHLNDLADKLEGYSGADIEGIIDEAALEAFNRKSSINYEIIKEVIEKRQPSVNKEQLKKYEEWRAGV
jgi:SpoVK/Ycf46/Vps4 family AAA+-type ATPase